MNDATNTGDRDESDFPFGGLEETFTVPAAAVLAKPKRARQAKGEKRTDPHRVGAIIPEDYAYLLSYARPSGEAPFSYGIAEAIAAIHDPERVWFMHPTGGKGMGTCSVCGARFAMGDIWKHLPTGEHIHVGHECAEKYQLLADRGDFDAQRDAHKRATAARRLADRKAAERREFLDANPGLEVALTVDHQILRDMAARFRQYGSLSEKTVAFAIKLANEVQNPAPRAVEAHVPAPVGRVTVRGIIVSRKYHESSFGSVLKMTVKVTTPAGSWLAWGTVPASIEDPERGMEVEFTATLKQGNDAHFAIFSRPTAGRVIPVAEKG